jgi:hypothetical protein
METAVATPARFAADAAVPFPLRDVDDLHDADLDGVLADRLMDAGLAAASASELVDLLVRSAPAAMSAHTMGAQALPLAVR